MGPGKLGAIVYSGAGTVALTGGVTVAGVVFATTGVPGSRVLGLLAVIVAVLLGYRARRVGRAARTESR